MQKLSGRENRSLLGKQTGLTGINFFRDSCQSRVALSPYYLKMVTMRGNSEVEMGRGKVIVVVLCCAVCCYLHESRESIFR
jgi:hypothetical protein